MVDANANDIKTKCVILLVSSLHHGVLLAARTAPRSPEIDQSEFVLSDDFRKRNVLTFFCLQRKFNEGLTHFQAFLLGDVVVQVGLVNGFGSECVDHLFQLVEGIVLLHLVEDVVRNKTFGMGFDVVVAEVVLLFHQGSADLV